MSAERFMGITNLPNLRYNNSSGLKIVNTSTYPYFVLIFCYFNYCLSLTEGIGGSGVHFGGYSGHRAPRCSSVSFVHSCSSQVNAKGCVFLLLLRSPIVLKFDSPNVE